MVVVLLTLKNLLVLGVHQGGHHVESILHTFDGFLHVEGLDGLSGAVLVIKADEAKAEAQGHSVSVFHHLSEDYLSVSLELLLQVFVRPGFGKMFNVHIV